MNRYARLYWLCLVATGLLLAAQWVPLVADGVAVDTVAPLAGGLAMALAGGYALAAGRTTGAPEESNALLAVMVVAFLLTLAGAVVQFGGVV